MDQLNLFEDAPLSVEMSPGEQLELAALRSQWRARQRRCRANRRWMARVSSEPAIQVAADRTRSALCEHELTIERAIATNVCIAAIQIGGDLASRAFENLKGDDFEHPTLALVFETARAIHARGQLVTRAVVVAELRSRGVLLFDGGAMLDAVFDCPFVPAHLRPSDIEHQASVLKEA